jgi:hypothetical protein
MNLGDGEQGCWIPEYEARKRKQPVELGSCPRCWNVDVMMVGEPGLVKE